MAVTATRTVIDERSGQMAVEMAVMMPVVIVMALVVFNLMRFIEVCALFDRVSFDAVVGEGVSPAGEQSSMASTESVQREIEASLARWDECEIEVSATKLGDDPSSTLSLTAMLTRYECVLRFRPWPSSLSIAGVSMGSPVALEHRRVLVVDRYRSGVVA